MDKIFIKDLLVRCIVGVHEEERHNKQDVIINIVLLTDLRKPGLTDRLEDSIDYSSIRSRIVEMVEASNFHLIEALAQHVADLCLEHPAVERVQVTVEKPSALRFAKSVGVEITRERCRM